MLHFQTPCDIILLAGQSNMQGCGGGDCSNPYQADERVLLLGNQIPTYKKDAEDKEYLELFEPWEYKISVATLSDRGCIGHYFARQYVEKGLLKKGRKLMLVYAPVGGTGFCPRAWGTGKAEQKSGLWTMDGPLYKRMLQMLDDALSLNPENKIVGVLWHQGEADVVDYASVDTLCAHYERNFSALLSSVFERYELSNTPVVAGKFVNEWAQTEKERCAQVYKATQKTLSAYNSAYLETSDLPSNNQAFGNGDTIHFCHESLRILGERYFDAYQKLLIKD